MQDRLTDLSQPLTHFRSCMPAGAALGIACPPSGYRQFNWTEMWPRDRGQKQRMLQDCHGLKCPSAETCRCAAGDVG